MNNTELATQLREYASNPGYSHNDYADTMREAAAVLASQASKGAGVGDAVPLPDMFWDADNPEDMQGNGVEDFAENYASSNMAPGEEAVVTVLCATRIHKRKMCITVTRDEDNWLQWRWLDNPLPPDAAPSPAQAQPVAHRQGCDALGGYGNGIGPCSCGAQPVAKDLTQTIREYLLREMPSGTVISDPAWWAPRIARVVSGSQPVADDAPSYKAAYWFDCLSQCAKLLELDDETPIPSGVVDAVKALAGTKPSTAKADASYQQGRAAGIEEAAKVAGRCYVKDPFKFELGIEAATAIRALAAKKGGQQ